ncbi:DUF5996 family protein [Parerythrobacter jejuensis]|uniref:Uncharacterized protein n=1 Tax=Parerythrobacter jejuensis TaxID=795812 RepID=A0A845AU07_9SPHN|nr:DUF5996 family protein [Parerythrobacter jejuensis]MXP32797.1 hypothetical protein [Parerythrobacter jejuensis]
MSAWPHLDFSTEQPVYESAHLYLQLIGKLPTRLHPWINHGWHVALRVTPRGFATRTMEANGKSFAVEFDCHGSRIVIGCDSGEATTIALTGQSVAELHGQLSDGLNHMGLPAPLFGAPNELPEVIAFSQDMRDRSWDPDVIRRAHAAFRSVDAVFTRFRAAYLGKSSPSHLFWGSFDLAVTRFSGRRAPLHPGGFPNLPDRVTREAYSHEVISAGFWLGGGGVDEAAFYAYAYPSPEDLAASPVTPRNAYWHKDLGEFVLPYAAVASSADPQECLLGFLETSYDAAAGLAGWPSDLVTARACVGEPAQNFES